MEEQHAHNPTAKQVLLAKTQVLTDLLTGFIRELEEDLSRSGARVWCAITVMRGEQSTTIASSDDRAQALDQMQQRFADGPGLSAAREHTLVHVGDTRTDARWPDYLQAIAAEGIHCMLGTSVDVAHRELKAGLNVYCSRTHAFDSAAILAIRAKATAASTVLRM